MQKAFLYAVLLLFVVSCGDKDSTLEEEQSPKNCRLVKMIQGTNNGAVKDTTFNFYYDAAGKLNQVTEFYAGYNQADTVLLAYNESGKLVKIMNTNNTPTTTITYTSNGLISEIRHFTHGYDNWRFVYGSSSLPEKCVKATYTSFGGFTHLDSVEYHYTHQNGNIVSREVFIDGVSKVKTNIEYDTLPNFDVNLSLLSLSDVPLGLSEEYLFFNKNLLKRKTSSDRNYDGSHYTSYKLDSGRVAQSLRFYQPDPAPGTIPNATRNYFWECN